MKRAEILDLMANEFSQFSPQIQRCAKWILDNPNAVAVTSMRQLASTAGVTPTTLVRLIKRLGFDSYNMFRDRFKMAMLEPVPVFKDRAQWLQEIEGSGGDVAVIREVATASLSNLEALFSSADTENMTNIADQIRQSPNTYLVVSGALRWISASFQYVTRMAVPNLHPPRPSGGPIIDDLIEINPGDVALALMVEPYANETAQAANFAKQRGATVISLTDSRVSPLVPISDFIVFVSTKSPQLFPSLIGMLAALETITALIVARSDRATIDRIDNIDSMRIAEGVYWKPIKKG
jgi:DNA-binding MurR/RpiR family transcriptional regulator